MASNGSIATGYSNSTRLVLDWRIVNQDINKNQTKISWSLYANRSTSGWVYGRKIKATINGIQVAYIADNRQLSNGTVLATGEFDFAHNEIGDAQAVFTIEGAVYQHAINVSAKSTYDLDRITRKAWIEHANDFTDSTNPRLFIKNPGDLRVDVCLQMYAQEFFRRQTVRTNDWYNLDLTSQEREKLLELLRTHNTYNFNYVVITYVNDKEIGRQYLSRTVTVENANPTITGFDVEEVDSDIATLMGSTGKINADVKFVQSKSRLKIKNITGISTLKSATVERIEYSIDTVSGRLPATAREYSFSNSENLTTAGTRTVLVKVVDSRGNTAVATKQINVLPYSMPTILAEAKRKNEFNTETALTFTGAIARLTNINDVIKVRYRFKEKTDNNSGNFGEWIEILKASGLEDFNHSSDNTNFKNYRLKTVNSKNEILRNFDRTKAYVIEVEVFDKLGSTTTTIELRQGKPFLFIDHTNEIVEINERRVLTVDDYSPKKYIQIRQSSQTSIRAGNNDIPLETVEYHTGNLGVIENGRLKITGLGNTDKYVNISANVFLESTGRKDGSYAWVKIYKNSDKIASSIVSLSQNYETLTIPNKIIPLKNNDVIKVVVEYTGDNANCKTRHGSDDTWLSIVEF